LTLSELRDRAYDRLGIDATEQTALALDSTLNEYLNEANRQAAIWSKSLVASTMITTLAKVPNYDLPSDCVAVLAVFRSSPRTKVYPFDQRDLDEYRRNWRESPSDHATNYMVFNTNELWLLPVPSAASEDYLVYYYQDPGETSMAADSDEPDMIRTSLTLLSGGTATWRTTPPPATSPALVARRSTVRSSTGCVNSPRLCGN